MKLKQLKDIMEQFSDEEAEGLTVMIQIVENTIGPTPAENVSYVFNGFDWDNGRFIIVPEKQLMRFQERVGTDVPKSKFIRVIDGNTICKCPVCRTDIDCLDKFCKNCGQRLVV